MLRLVTELFKQRQTSGAGQTPARTANNVAAACLEFETRLGDSHKRYVYVDGENLMYTGEVETFSQLFHKVRAEYPGDDTCVAVVFKHARGRKLRECVDVANTLCICCDRRIQCRSKDEVDDVALLACALMRARHSGAQVVVYSDDRYRWLTTRLPGNMDLAVPGSVSVPEGNGFLYMLLSFTTFLFGVQASSR